MSAKFIPSGSQTVGPFFRIGLQHMVDRQEGLPSVSNVLELRGKVIDGNGAGVPDALLEFWSVEFDNDASRSQWEADGLVHGFYRAATEEDGSYAVKLVKPSPTTPGNVALQAPHFLVLVFARGLLRHLLARMYFMDDAANEDDPVLHSVPVDRRDTLMARPDQGDNGIFYWDVVLQGENETAFFAW